MPLDLQQSSFETSPSVSTFSSPLHFFAQLTHNTLGFWENIFRFNTELLQIQKEMMAQHKNPLSYTTTQGEYQTFMSSQKSRKVLFETALRQLQLWSIKQEDEEGEIITGYLHPEFQRLENYIRTHLAFTFTFERPSYQIQCENEQEITETDRMKLLCFTPNHPSQENAYFLIAPISGHFPTLLRKTIQALLDAGYNVYVTDWKSPLEMHPQTQTNLDAYTQDIADMYAEIEKHNSLFDVLAVCQPGPITLSSLALSESLKGSLPRSVTLMASPIDTSVNPTQVGKVGESLSPFALHNAQLTSPKSGKQVYPGTYQISNFISANFKDHLEKFTQLAYKNTPLSAEEEKILAFYHEYFAVMDIPFDFFRETIQRVFQNREWATGKTRFGDRLLDIDSIKTPLCIIEGEKDDICGIGETQAALHITGQGVSQNNYICVPGAGHYGVFAGKAFRETVIPFMGKFQKSL